MPQCRGPVLIFHIKKTVRSQAFAKKILAVRTAN